MIHHGQRIYSIAQTKGYNKSKLARELGKTHQAVDYDLKRQIVNIDTLEKYANILQVELKEFIEPTDNVSINTESYWKEMYFQALQKIDKLSTAIIENGIKIDLGKFEVISLPRVGGIFFAHANTANNNYGL